MGRTVELDLAGDHALARDLVAGGVFVPGVVLKLNEDIVLVLRNSDTELALRATCVWVDEATGSGLQLLGCDAAMKQQIAELAERTPVAAVERAGAALESAPAAAVDNTSFDDAALESALDEAAADELAADELAADEALAADTVQSYPHSNEALDDDVHGDHAHGDDAYDDDLHSDEAQSDEPNAEATDESQDSDKSRYPQSIQQRLRGLTLVQQVKVAQHGEIQERTLLERMYGKNVWEVLLRNPRVTGPEVARIARMGALPRPLIEIIVGNGAWLQIPEVRRALLSNPRLGNDHILRILRLLPKHELKLASIQTAYPFAVRDAAKRMIRENAGG